MANLNIPLTLRQIKGSPLTFSEGDTNFTNLRDAINSVHEEPKFTNPMTNLGDLIVGGTSGVATRLGIGSSGQILTVSSGVPSWESLAFQLPTINSGTSNEFLTNDGLSAFWASPFPDQSSYTIGGYYLYTNGTTVSWQLTPPALRNPMITSGDIIVGGVLGAGGRLGIGVVGQVLTATSSTTLGWTSVIPAMSSATNNYFLTNNGTITNWTSVIQVPSIVIGQTGYLLSNNGTIPQWIINTTPPSVIGQAGNFLTNNGTTTNWTAINQVPATINNGGKFLATDGASYFWSSGALTNPMTAYGDIIHGSAGGSPVNLQIGTVGQVLTVYDAGSHLDAHWSTPSFISPMTYYGDLIIGGVNGSAIKLAVGSAGQVLSSYDTGFGYNSVHWTNTLSNPMTNSGDIIIGGVSGAANRLGIGAANTVLCSNGLEINWATVIPPMIGNSGLFLTNNGTAASWGSIPSQFPSQTSNGGKYLTTDGINVSWNTVSAGFANPLTATGDILVSTVGTTPGVVNIGSSGQVLTVVSGGPSWQPIPSQIPSQTGNSGYFLTTNGTNTSWYQINQLVPTVSGGTNGQFLGNNGTTFSWMALPNQVPSISGQSGKYLSTDGSVMQWSPIQTIPSTTGNAGKVLGTDGTIVYWLSQASSSSLGVVPLSFTSGSLTVNASEIDTVTTTCYAFQIFNISVNTPCRIRFYGTMASATADLSRLSSTPPTGNLGLMAEFLFISTALSWICSPVPTCFNNDASPSQIIYMTVQNIGASTTTITVTATLLKLE